MSGKQNQSFYISKNTKQLMQKNAKAMQEYGVHGLFVEDGDLAYSRFLEQSMIILNKLFEKRKKNGDD